MKKAIFLGCLFISSLSAGPVLAQLEFVKKLQNSIDEKVSTKPEKGRTDSVTLDAKTNAEKSTNSGQSKESDVKGGGEGKSN